MPPMADTKRKARIWANPYLFSLVLCLMILMTAPLIYLLLPTFRGDPNGYDLPATLALLTPYVASYICYGVMSREIFGHIVFYDDKLILKAPLRRSIKMNYADIEHIQIDYNVLTINKQFWVILGLEPMPEKYRHRVNALPVSEKILRIQYSKKLDGILCDVLTGKAYKQYTRAKSTLRAYKEPE